MAKKKTDPKPSVSLTDEQIKTIAQRILSSGGNVYTYAESAFGAEFTDDDWDRLRLAGAFKCPMCDRWLPTNAMYDKKDPESACLTCMA